MIITTTIMTNVNIPLIGNNAIKNYIFLKYSFKNV